MSDVMVCMSREKNASSVSTRRFLYSTLTILALVCVI